jgi:hypothetical protein
MQKKDAKAGFRFDYKLCLILSALFYLTFCSPARAKYSGGSGSKRNPYRIATPEDMNSIGTNQTDWNKFFVLVNDIDMSGYTAESFNIIGIRYLLADDPKNKPFTGIFDGNNHTISNFTYNTTETTAVGLFGFVYYGRIKNLTLENVNLNAGDAVFVGSLVGLLEDATLQNCFSKNAAVSCFRTDGLASWSGVGGLVGFNFRGEINNCHSTTIIETNHWNIGGLIGNTNQGSVSNCSAKGHIISSDDEVGGLIGNNKGAIQCSFADCNTTGVLFVGGLVGTMDNHASISDSYSTGRVDGKGSQADTGGLVGRSVGHISNCYSTGRVDGNIRAGGLIGVNWGPVENCFWDVETSHRDTSAAGTGLNTEQMQQRNSFTDEGWDFLGENDNGMDNTWRMCTDGVDYPRLTWQIDRFGDFECPDGIDGSDLAIFSEDWLAVAFTSDVDFSRNGKIDLRDWTVFARSWLSTEGEPNWNVTCDVAPPGGDRIINGADMAVFLNHWLQTSDYKPRTDIAPEGSDGIVNNKDFAVLAENWLAGL